MIWHHALESGIPNIDYHNFVNAYVCNVGSEYTGLFNPLPMWLDLLRYAEVKDTNPLEGVGDTACYGR